ncbi:GNAT family N-acetyltransferase [Arsenicicoccus sp. oral taxon 190]|uniref:GNAT family N-acetyltransferase n=1 Tax=Arsenicicoccus sp. oral taxon 190 TaxID=1658671 RepID=UPI00067A04DC|nr:GNAT family N-acetyltransferase [Arsenicicoccus sp. oral taxon 190]AKT51078.1 hypothetical protein ADJ73_06655 [Arsenicicoccus sp. oral taxon 190]
MTSRREATDPVTRLLAPADARASWDLGAESFGYPGPVPDPLPDPTRDEQIAVGSFVGDRLVARAVALADRSWWGGREVATAGIASVAIALEQRGEGLLAPLLADLLDRARHRGDALATLYPTAQGIYRSSGFETVTSFDQVELDTRDLLAARADRADRADRAARGADASPVTLRRGTGADHDAVHRVYTAWARRHDGPLTRSGPRFPADAEAFLQALDGVQTTVAEQDGEVTGYALWQRADGYHRGVTAVDDLLATTPEAYLSLLHHLGSSYAVAPRTTLWTSGDDVIRVLLPSNAWRRVDCRPYKLAVLDVPAALAARGWAPHVDAELRFAVTGPAPVAGCYRLRVEAGRATCEPDASGRADGIRVMSPRSLALTYAGARSSASQRAVGLLDGPTTNDATWDALTGGRAVQVRDYF